MSDSKEQKMSSESDLTGPERGPAVDGEHRVLIIDDDRDVGAMVARFLKPTPVIFAQSASGALGRIAAGGRFGAIVCDIHMPGLDGIQFHAAVAAQAPKAGAADPLHHRFGEHGAPGRSSSAAPAAAASASRSRAPSCARRWRSCSRFQSEPAPDRAPGATRSSARLGSGRVIHRGHEPTGFAHVRPEAAFHTRSRTERARVLGFLQGEPERGAVVRVRAGTPA